MIGQMRQPPRRRAIWAIAALLLVAGACRGDRQQPTETLTSAAAAAAGSIASSPARATQVPETQVPETQVSETAVAPTQVAPTQVAPTQVAPTQVAPTQVAPTPTQARTTAAVSIPPTSVATPTQSLSEKAPPPSTTAVAVTLAPPPAAAPTPTPTPSATPITPSPTPTPMPATPNAVAATAEPAGPVTSTFTIPTDELPLATLIAQDGTSYDLPIEVPPRAEYGIGLAGRTELIGRGMLFWWREPIRPRFWMHGTHIDIDIAFVDEEGVIVDVFEMEAGTERIWQPDALSRFAIEAAGGWFAERGVEAGGRAVLNFEIPAGLRE